MPIEFISGEHFQRKRGKSEYTSCISYVIVKLFTNENLQTFLLDIQQNPYDVVDITIIA